jgi:uncharacterized tellurite resistance protein B-like protein
VDEMTNRNELIADLLMGAAYADRKLDGRELEAVKKLMADLMSVETIPGEIAQRLEEFDPKSFDAAAAAKALEIQDDDEKLKVVELIATVTEADEEIDLDENDYLEDVARALDMPRHTYSDLAIEVMSIEDIKSTGKKLLNPPPIPEAAKKK